MTTEHPSETGASEPQGGEAVPERPDLPDDPDVPTRARRPWMPKFLAALAERGIVADACRVSLVSRSQAYAWRKDDPSFALDWDDAYQQAMDTLEAEAVRRAYRGVEEPVIFKGELSGRWVDAEGRTVAAEIEGSTLVPLTVTRYSDTLLMFLLNGGRPEKYRQRGQVEVQVRMGEQATDIIATLEGELEPADG